MNEEFEAAIAGHDVGIQAFYREAVDMLYRAHQVGIVIRISSTPQLPLAMGNYRDNVEIRRARTKA
jgi:hypothetical protein